MIKEDRLRLNPAKDERGHSIPVPAVSQLNCWARFRSVGQEASVRQSLQLWDLPKMGAILKHYLGRVRGFWAALSPAGLERGFHASGVYITQPRCSVYSLSAEPAPVESEVSVTVGGFMPPSSCSADDSSAVTSLAAGWFDVDSGLVMFPISTSGMIVTPLLRLR